MSISAFPVINASGWYLVAPDPKRQDRNIEKSNNPQHSLISHHLPSFEDRNLSVIMALDSFFHNKIESMKLEIIQGQAVLRRLEAQRNDYNSRGGCKLFSLSYVANPEQYDFCERSLDYYNNLGPTSEK